MPFLSLRSHVSGEDRSTIDAEELERQLTEFIREGAAWEAEHGMEYGRTNNTEGNINRRIMDAEETEQEIATFERWLAVWEAEEAVEDSFTNSTEENPNHLNTSITAGAGDGTNRPPSRPFRSAPSSSAFPSPDDITLDPDLITFMRDTSIGSSRLAAGEEREIVGNSGTRAPFIGTTQLGSPIDANTSFDDFLGGLDRDARELTTDEIPRLAARDDAAEWEEAARRDRSRRKFSRGLTALQEYRKAYTMLDEGWATGDERREWQLRVQMAMDRVKRERDEEGEGDGGGYGEAV